MESNVLTACTPTGPCSVPVTRSLNRKIPLFPEQYYLCWHAAHTVVLAQTRVGFLTGGREKSFLDLTQDEQTVQLEEAHARATVAITETVFGLDAAWLNEGRCPGGRPSVSEN